jgi:hypothetical protein
MSAAVQDPHCKSVGGMRDNGPGVAMSRAAPEWERAGYGTDRADDTDEPDAVNRRSPLRDLKRSALALRPELSPVAPSIATGPSGVPWLPF